MTYEEYIDSPQWKALRTCVLKRDNCQCQTCLSEESLEVHHKTYERLFNERLEDLITLCHECHEAITAVMRRRKYKKRAIVLKNVERLTPTIGNLNSDVSKFELQVNRCQPATFAQRANSRPQKLLLKDVEASFFKKKQD